MKSVKIERDVTREWLDADIRLCGWCDPRLSREGTQIGKDHAERMDMRLLSQRLSMTSRIIDRLLYVKWPPSSLTTPHRDKAYFLKVSSATL